MLIDPAKQILYVSKVRPHDTRKGLSTLLRPDGRVHSVQPDGSVHDQPENFDGRYEACQVSGSFATFQPEDGKLYTFGFVLVDALL